MTTAFALTGLTGAAGEYHIAAQLSQRGWLATPTIKNSPGTDVLAQHVGTGALVAIQAKTTTGSTSWVLGAKDEGISDGDHSWYVFVALAGQTERPVFYVLPRNHVAALLFVGHRNYIKSPGRGGRERKNGTVRKVFAAEIAPYREDWDALLAPTSARPYALPDWFERYVPEIGLPPGHPDAARFGVAWPGREGDRAGDA